MTSSDLFLTAVLLVHSFSYIKRLRLRRGHRRIKKDFKRNYFLARELTSPKEYKGDRARVLSKSISKRN